MQTYNLILNLEYEDSKGNTYENSTSIGVVVLKNPLL